MIKTNEKFTSNDEVNHILNVIKNKLSANIQYKHYNKFSSNLLSQTQLDYLVKNLQQMNFIVKHNKYKIFAHNKNFYVYIYIRRYI